MREKMQRVIQSKYMYTGQEVAEAWEARCGETPWSKAARRFGELGGMIRWLSGYPRSASAIPLTFRCLAPDGKEICLGYSRLKDLKYAVSILEGKGI